MDFNLRHLAKPSIKLPEKSQATKAGEFDPNAKHENMLRAIAPFAKGSTQQTDMGEDSLSYVTRKTKLMLILLPEWSPFFPPFNLARLAGVARHAGFQTRLMDVNVRARQEYLRTWEPEEKIPFRLWNPVSTWRWTDKETYINTLHPYLEPIFEQCLREIQEYGPDVVGFTQYYTNEQPTNWMAKELKKRMPHVKTAVGGSNLQNGWHTPESCYDYIVHGEGEEAILKILEEVEKGVYQNSPQTIRQPEEQRLSINEFPMPNYTGIDFNQYEIPNGVNSELSRGCTAKCTFCEETHFYKYRQRDHSDAIREIEYLNKTKGTDVIWFIDSLVNGSLRELRAFCKGIIAKGLKIKWTGYCRCDGRMDRAFYQDLADSGCVMLNYGIESGSQKVLNDMNKGVTIEEMEQNFRDGKAVGVWAATNWIIGFPTERYQDFADTMTFLWRNRDMNINNIGAGIGYSLGVETIVSQNVSRFNVLDHKYMDHWITKDYKVGGLHIMKRVKSFNIFLDHMLSVNPVCYAVRDSLKHFHYKIEFETENLQKEISYESFDYDIIKANINPFADTLVNEIWPLLRMLWRTRGGYKATILFNPEIDRPEFGKQFGPGLYTAEHRFEITNEGAWSADFKFIFEQKGIENDWRPPERQGPFVAQDYSRIYSSSAIRARKIAKPSWGQAGRSDKEFADMLTDEEGLNRTINFSFNYAWQGSGQWTESPVETAVDISSPASAGHLEMEAPTLSL